MTRQAIFILLLFCVTGFQREPVETFRNPLLPAGADPWSIYKDGYYYYTNTYRDRLVIWKTKNLAGLNKAMMKTIWEPPENTMYSKHIWAPELHYVKGKWYMYFAADNGENRNHRLYVLENSSEDPLTGEWKFRGKVSDPSDKWAIDGSVFEYENALYMIWSGWERNHDGQQNIYIAKMKNPWTIEGERVLISTPELSWERFGEVHRGDSVLNVEVNEGPQFLRNGDHLFIVYSASGCWTSRYSLGMLQASSGDDLLKRKSWKKFPHPVFAQSPEDSVFSPGHNSFFKSPDGTEDWILYHANSKPGQGCGKFRSPRAQRFTWNADGTPYFGKPVSTNQYLVKPSE